MTKAAEIRALKATINRLLLAQNKPTKNLNKHINQIDFAQANKAGSQLYKGVLPMMRHLPTQRMVGRFSGLFMRILTQQKKRSLPWPYLLETATSQHLLKTLDCNKNALLSPHLRGKIQVNKFRRGITIPDFNHEKDLCTPDGCSDICLQLGVLSINFEQAGKFSLGQSKALYLPVKAPVQDIQLPLLTFPMGIGLKLYLLQILFMKQIGQAGQTLAENGLYVLHKNYNILSVVDVD